MSSSKNIISKGDLGGTFLNVLKSIKKYPEKDFLFNHFIENDFDYWSEPIKGILNGWVKFQVYSESFEDIKDFFKEGEFESVADVEIDLKEFELRPATEALKNLFAKRSNTFTLVQLNNVYSFKNEKWESNIEEHIPSNSITMGDKIEKFQENNFSFLDQGDKLQLVKKCKEFVGFPGIYSYYATLFKKKQLILGSEETYSKDMKEFITFFDDEKKLIEYLKNK